MSLLNGHQSDLFAHVAEAYVSASDGCLDNAALYERVADRAGLSTHDVTMRVPIGRAGQKHSLVKRAVRWHQQTLKAMGVVERVPGERGVWRLANVNRKGLHEARPGVQLVAFSTKLGVAIWGACETVFAGLDQPISLAVCSPPYPLAKPRDYGNPSEREFTDFICRAIEPVIRHLAPGGSVCLNLGNDVFVPGSPARSLYRERLMIALCDRFGLHKMDSLIWIDRSKAPGPIQWASKKRVQLNTAYEVIDWFTNDPTKVNADNRRVLEAHTKRHLRLIAAGGEEREGVFANGAYTLKRGAFANVTAGRIPRNVIERGHRCADADRYRRDAKALALPLHGARQPLSIPDFLIRFLSSEGELIVDPFGGTVTTGMAAEQLNRRWLVAELMLDYLRGSAERFRGCDGFRMSPSMEAWNGCARRACPPA